MNTTNSQLIDLIQSVTDGETIRKIVVFNEGEGEGKNILQSYVKENKSIPYSSLFQPINELGETIKNNKLTYTIQETNKLPNVSLIKELCGTDPIYITGPIFIETNYVQEWKDLTAQHPSLSTRILLI